MSVLAIIACTITAYCWAAGNETVSERAYVAQSPSGQQVNLPLKVLKENLW